MIPEDWKVNKLGKHATFKTGPFGSTLHKSDYVDGGIPIINPMQIVDGEIQPTSSMTVTKQTARKLADFSLSAGNIVIGRRGEMGRCALVKPEQHGWLCGTGSMIVRTAFSLDGGFIKRVLSSSPIVAAIQNTSVGSTMINLNQHTLGNLLIPLPPTLTEQKAIAGALSDADALIESLEQLIAKKRQVKQGTMQDLLTGRRRLPGFSGEWEVRRLGDVASLYQPITISANQFTASGYPVYGANGIVGFYNNYNHDSWQVTVTCRGSTCGTVNRTVEKCWITGNAMVISCDDRKQVDKTFLYYLLTSQDLSTCITGTGQPQIVRTPLANYELRISTALSEQKAIATILSDMDAVIAALEKKLEKARQVKQGMMQELLTGRIRLI